MTPGPPENHILIVHPDPDGCRPLMQVLESKGCKVVIASDTEAGLSQPSRRRFKLFIISDSLKTMSSPDFIHALGEQALTSVIPSIALTRAEPSGRELARWHSLGAAAALPESTNPSDIASVVMRLLDRQTAFQFDPVTKLIAGPYLDRQLDRLCEAGMQSWHFVEIKLLGIKAFNHQRGYDEGDKLMAELAAAIEETALEIGAETDLAGRLQGPRFCIASRTRRIDTLCRTLMNKSGRLFRKFYTPFEWMKGCITIESGKNAGDYPLCDIIAAAVQVPAKWDNNRAFLFDIAEEVLEKIPKSKQKYMIVTP